ncbi:hypothetical protein MP11Mi_05120 [Gordonia sp. MP11Mi]|uniref:Uncharacterized protein n=1 Tax=Gordonia sp. MP11Mi TaxID=3022769 RepID=A0AA97CSD7_9ACTN
MNAAACGPKWSARAGESSDESYPPCIDIGDRYARRESNA